MEAPSVVDVQTYVSSPDSFQGYVVWISPQSNQLDQVVGFTYLQLFFVFMTKMIVNSNYQIGIVLDSGDDFRYPGGNMSYILNSNPCNNSKGFDTRCLKAYYDPSTMISQSLSMYFQYNLTLMHQANDSTTCYYYPSNYFIESGETDTEYTYLLSNKQGENVYIFKNFTLDQLSGKNISDIFITQQYEISAEIDPVLLPVLSENSTFLDIEGYNTEYYIATSNLSIDGCDYPTGLVVTTLVIKSLALEDFYYCIDQIYNSIISQVSVFLLFIALGMITAWKLSKSIHKRVTEPLGIIECYLRGGIPKIPKMRYNKEINEINKYLLYIEVIEQILDPRFLLHPDFAQRLENLTDVDSLFSSIKNSQGAAISKNLIGNLYLFNEEYEKAIDSYREALAETETLFNEVVAQEHSESKLSFEERGLLRVHTGKDAQGWEKEKSFLSSSVSDRLQQLCYAKILSLENSLDSAHELRGEWKSVLELQTKILQYFISSSKNYVEMLKILIDMAYVSHKLQYYHSALELLDIANDELCKLNPEYTEQSKRNSKNYTVDIDITRLKRLGIKVKESEHKKLYFRITGVTFEKDILRQFSTFRRAEIYFDNEKYYDAVVQYTMALVRHMQEQGTWYDPDIRKTSIEKIYSIFCKFKLLNDQPELIIMHEKFQVLKRCIIFCLCYDIPNETTINEAISNFVCDEVQSQNEKFGVITGEIDSKSIMSVVERDYPGLDIENLISSSIYQQTQQHLYDVVLQAMRMLPNKSLENLIVIIAKDLHCNYGPTRVEDIDDEIKSTKIAMIDLDGLLDSQFSEFLNKNDFTYISKPTIRENLEDLRVMHFS